MVFFAGVLVLPMLADGVGCFDEPSTVFGRFQNVRRGEILGGVLGGIAGRLEQPRRNQRGDVMCLAVQHPARLLRREAGGQLAETGVRPWKRPGQDLTNGGNGSNAPTMPRKLRLEYPGAMYHLMGRGDPREDIFLDDVDRQDLIETLAEACQKTGWQAQAYCLSPQIPPEI